ncbi:hypothetical protein K1719_005895 [Acacia pycnantha]|nr:hypothetical protein K1719_005895 [Acacia pycnantha]
METRACIHTPGHPPMAPEELSESSLLAALDGARIVYFDVRLHETALVIARKRLKSLPKLPPQLLRLDAVGCDSMEPLSETQLWNMVSSLDHKYCHQVKYENTLSSTLRFLVLTMPTRRKKSIWFETCWLDIFFTT